MIFGGLGLSPGYIAVNSIGRRLWLKGPIVAADGIPRAPADQLTLCAAPGLSRRLTLKQSADYLVANEVM